MLIAVLAPVLIACHMSASPVCEVAQPRNIQTGILQQEFIDLLQRSATFRRQCARIAATKVLRVTLHIGTVSNPLARAQTIINRYDAGGIRAEVTLRFAEDYLELLAHEFEHIIEQIDGVSLSDEALQGRAWRTPSGAFETRRAFDAGMRAREEYEAPPLDAVQVEGRKPAARRPPFD
jgi:hypothetical protein